MRDKGEGSSSVTCIATAYSSRSAVFPSATSLHCSSIRFGHASVLQNAWLISSGIRYSHPSSTALSSTNSFRPCCSSARGTFSPATYLQGGRSGGR